MSEKLKNKIFSQLKGIEYDKVVDVQHAYCPKGCNLMSDKVKIGGLDSILVDLEYNDERGKVYLDPEYGSFNHKFEIEVPEGEVVELFCPHCGVSLTEEGEKCNTCSSPVFHLDLPDQGTLIGCLKKGCFDHKLKVVSFDSMHLQLDNDYIRVIM
ncbi:MAG: hypothetical protein K9M80_00520 [Candidatus Marinimicrobia bacterium]|nr:hypothetical protein [Candidatus Neomarinimicrobiota bacterium]